MVEDAGRLQDQVVAVTGALGFVGRQVVDLLTQAGAHVIAVHRPGEISGAAGELGEPVCLDLESGDNLGEVLSGVGLVVHLAARSGGVQFQGVDNAGILESNTTITANVLRAATEAGVARVFLASSGVVYAPTTDSLLDESHPTLRPGVDAVTGYAWSKLTDEVAASWVVAGSQTQVVIGRFDNIYGPSGDDDPSRSTVVHALVRRALDAGPRRELTVWGDGTQVRSFIHVEDAARAALTVLLSGDSGTTYNISSSGPIAIGALAEMIRQTVDPSLCLRFNPLGPKGEPVRVLDNSQLLALGYRPRISLSDGVRQTVASFAQRGARQED